MIGTPTRKLCPVFVNLQFAAYVRVLMLSDGFDGISSIAVGFG